MIKKISVLALVICLFLAVLSPTLAQVKGELTISNSSAQIEFPLKFNFTSQVKSDVNVTDIRLRYKVDQISFAEVTSEGYVEFAPRNAVDAKWTLDMRKTGGLPPGAILDYWWVAKNARGESFETSLKRVRFEDTRYSWQSLSEGKVTIYWYEGAKTFAQALMSTAQQALVKLANDTGATLEKPVRIYIYAGSKDLQGAMVFPQEWTGGAAFTEHGIIAIGISPAILAWGQGAMTHELTHLVIYQVTVNPYNELPTWLNEGLAMYAEGPLSPEYTARIAKALADNNLITVRSLASPFSAYTDKSLLSYAESFSLVEFLIRQYGSGKMLELLNTFKRGSGYDEAFSKVYGFDMDALNTLWRDYAKTVFAQAK